MEQYTLTIVLDCGNRKSDEIQKTIHSIETSSNKSHNIEIFLLNSKASQVEAFCRIREIDEKNIIDGLKLALYQSNGKYIQILSAGDYYFSDSLSTIMSQLNSNKYDLIKCSLLSANNKFNIQKRYDKKEQLEYTSEDFYHLPTQIKSCFFKKSILAEIDFNQVHLDCIDTSFLSQIISFDSISCLTIFSAIIAYLNHDSIVEINDNVEFNQYLSLFISNKKPTIFQQYLALNELKQLLSKLSIKIRMTWENDNKVLFLDKIKQILLNIDDTVILNNRSITIQYKHYFFSLKLGERYLKNLEVVNVKAGKKLVPFVNYEENPLFDLTAVGNFKINIMEVNNDKLVLDGIDVFSFLSEKYEIIAIDNKKRIYRPQSLQWPLSDKQGFVGEKVFEGHRFKFEIPLKKISSLHFKLINKKDSKEFEIVPSFGTYSKLVKKIRTSYYASDNYLIRYQSKGLKIYPKTFLLHFKFEMKLWIQMLSQKKMNMIFMRFCYHLLNNVKRKPVWLMRDNEKRAKDSGAEMFKFFSKWDKKDVANAYFILDKNCSDYQKMKNYGNIIQPDSFKYRLFHLLADKLIDSRGGINPKYVFKDDADYVKDLCHWDYIWLIHGIMTRNESTWTNKYVLNAKLFATCNVREYASVLDEANGYGYDKSEVCLTGLPRHDDLDANKQKKILFLPTWRKHLAGDLIPGTSDRSYVENFKSTDYFQFYNQLLNDERLLSVMREKGYTGDFYLHPSFMKQCNDFEENDVMRVGKEPADTNKLIGECSLLITDYSSAQFEGAYLDTPVIYPQYDADTFSENHTGNDGYFDYEKDGFGPVCYNLDETVTQIINYIQNDCKSLDPYATRAKEFFEYHDKKNSERVFNQILKIDGLNKDYHIEEKNDFIYLYEDQTLLNVLPKEKKESILNSFFRMNSYIRYIDMKEKSFVIKGTLINPTHIDMLRRPFELVIGDATSQLKIINSYRKNKMTYYDFDVEMSYEKVLLTKKSTAINIKWSDEKNNGLFIHLKYQYVASNDSLSNYSKRILHCSKTKILEEQNTSIFIRESKGNNAFTCVRDINRTDYLTEKRKIKLAYLCSKLLVVSKIHRSVLCFEKFTSKYEESASVLFEKIIDNGELNTYFVIDKTSDQFQNIPKKYKKNIIEKYSFKHYLYFFMAHTFIATESMNHLIELNISIPEVTMRIEEGAFDYIFLQHGVMYMYCLENRSDFIKGQGFNKNSKVVVSSQTEADHFIEYGNFTQDDLILSGLPKFDRSIKKMDADKILIMPTSRDFEYNVIRLTPTESTYYQFVKNIIEEVPDELKSKIVVVGHPLLKDQLHNTDLNQYIPDKINYNELLSETKLLITDYSSISYDAFYRGSNVIFCWEDKDMCLSAMNYKLMLNDENVFADVSYEFTDLKSLIHLNYYSEQSQEHVSKYRDIVQFHDNQNTERCFDYLMKNGYYGKRHRMNIKQCEITGFAKRAYTSFQRRHLNVVLFDGKRELVKNRDYQIYYLNNKNKSKFAFAIIVGKANYYGFKIKRFKICEHIKSFDISGIQWNNDTISFDNLVVKKGNRYLKYEKDFVIEIEETIDQNTVKVWLIGKKDIGGKVNVLVSKN